MNKQIWRSADTQKPCMCSFWAPTTTKSYKMSPQMPLFIPITSKISANNNNLSCSILRRRRTCSISTSTSTLSLATTKIHRMSPQMPLSFLPFLKRGSIKSKDKNGSMNNWTIILYYSLTSWIFYHNFMMRVSMFKIFHNLFTPEWMQTRIFQYFAKTSKNWSKV